MENELITTTVGNAWAVVITTGLVAFAAGFYLGRWLGKGEGRYEAISIMNGRK